MSNLTPPTSISFFRFQFPFLRQSLLPILTITQSFVMLTFLSTLDSTSWKVKTDNAKSYPASILFPRQGLRQWNELSVLKLIFLLNPDIFQPFHYFFPSCIGLSLSPLSLSPISLIFIKICHFYPSLCSEKNLLHQYYPN